MNNKWKKVIGTVGLACLLTLSGCGNSKSTNTSDNVHQSNKKVHLVMTVWGGDTDKKAYTERADLYTKQHPNVTIDVKVLANYDQKVETMIAGGSAPDIMEVAQDSVPLGEQGAVMDLTSYIKKSNLNLTDRFQKGYLGEYQYKGKMYGLPDRGGYIMMYYNKDMFKKAGLKEPTKGWTWDEFEKDAKALTIQSGGKTTQWGFAGASWWPVMYSFIHQAGGQVLNSDMNKMTLDTGAAKSTLQWLNDLAYKDHVYPTPVQYANMGNGIGGDALFGQNKVAMLATGFWDVGSFTQSKVNFGIAPLPVKKQGAMVSTGSGLAVCAKSQNPDVAFDVIKFLTSSEGQKPIVDTGEDIPASKAGTDYWASKLPASVSYGELKSAEGEIISPKIPPQWTQMQDLLGNDLQPFWDNKASVSSAVSKAEQDINPLISGN